MRKNYQTLMIKIEWIFYSKAMIILEVYNPKLLAKQYG